MATLSIDYNKNIQVFTGLANSGSICGARETKTSNISEFKTALQETKTMSADIAQNGINGYKTLDDLLNED